jgi:hypothetical protein
MKTFHKILVGATVGAVLMLAANRTQASMTNVITFTATALVQSPANDNGTNTTTPAPASKSITTKTLLAWLALDEYAEGNYTAGTNFPSGAQLVVFDRHNRPPAFQVLTATNTLLVDVSDIVHAQEGFFGNDITSGKQIDTNGLASPTTTDIHLLTLSFDDSFVPATYGPVVGVQFYLMGLMTETTTDTKPSKAGVYTESKSSKMPNAAGEGFYQDQAFVISGSVDGAAKATYTLP